MPAMLLRDPPESIAPMGRSCGVVPEGAGPARRRVT